MHPDWRPGTVKAWEARRRRLAGIGFGDLRLTEIRAGDIQRALATPRSDGLGDRTLDATRGGRFSSLEGAAKVNGPARLAGLHHLY